MIVSGQMSNTERTRLTELGRAPEFRSFSESHSVSCNEAFNSLGNRFVEDNSGR